MRKLVRMLLWSASALGVLLAVLVALLFYIDVNLFRAPLERQVSAALGRARPGRSRSAEVGCQVDPTPEPECEAASTAYALR